MTETPVAQGTLYAARPSIRIDTQEYALINELLLGMRMTETEGGLSALELRFSNHASDTEGGADLAFEEGDILALGKQIILYAGDQSEPQEIFRGVITGLEIEFPESAPPELMVLAEDAFQRARMTRRSKTWEDKSIADIANAVAEQVSLRPVVSGFDQTGTWVQFNESDLAFLRRLLARFDGDLQVVGEEMHVSPRSDVQRGTVTLDMHSQLRAARVIADLTNVVTQVTASGWDVMAGESITATSSGTNFGPGQGSKGKEVLSDLSSVLGEGAYHIGHLAAANQQELQAIVDSAFDQRARRFVRAEGTAEGNPAIRVGTHVELTGLGPRFSNTYYVVRACHRYDRVSGYMTDFEAECGFMGNGS
ncbi:MAG: hypothetical protein KF716_07290 [Anaerolineae bacterium]|nr:hypothetical protein [Anaerolineae bacterium]